MNYDRLKGLYSSSLLFVFWLLVSLAIVPDIIGYSMSFQQKVSFRYEIFYINSTSLSRVNQYYFGFNLFLFVFIFSLHLDLLLLIVSLKNTLPVK